MGYPRVGLAEYIDLLTALHELTRENSDEKSRQQSQIDWLQQLSAYALVKHHDQDQNRPPVKAATAGEAADQM